MQGRTISLRYSSSLRCHICAVYKSHSHVLAHRTTSRLTTALGGVVSYVNYGLCSLNNMEPPRSIYFLEPSPRIAAPFIYSLEKRSEPFLKGCKNLPSCNKGGQIFQLPTSASIEWTLKSDPPANISRFVAHLSLSEKSTSTNLGIRT